MKVKELQCLTLIKEICEESSCSKCVFKMNDDNIMCGIDVKIGGNSIPDDWELSTI